jgi:serine protease
MPVTQTFTKTLQEDDRFQYGPFNAKAGTSVEAVTTGNGDPDLYLNFGGPATFGNADCSSEGGDADERCRRTTPSPASPAYVMVYAWGESTTYTLRVTYTPGP